MPQSKTAEKTEGITAKKEADMPEWYSQVCLKAELAEYATVKGCMVIRPNGYAIWQKIQDYFNENIIKKMKVRNAYFPLFIPESFFKKEAQHAKGFTPEVAWLDKRVTGEGERLAVRPTSETVMYDSYSRWIRSYRDLPLRINQWCNIVRWETEATKLFLRSREFLWQEGHCAYETDEDCDKETIECINLYAKLCKDLLAIPVIVGRKTDKEKFAGAKYTATIEAFMPDGKSLQMGTSHHLNQNFSKAFNIQFLGKDEKMHYVFQNSWGLSTRLIGALVMMHSDDKGLVLPPGVAEFKLVIVPIFFENSKGKVLKECQRLKKQLNEFNPILDDRPDYTPGWKFNEWELKGIPIRLELGPKDLEKKQAVLVRRDNGKKEFVKISELNKKIKQTLDDIHKSLYINAKKHLDSSTIELSCWKDFEKAIKQRKLVKALFCLETECEDWIKDKTGGASARCIPFHQKQIKGKCIHCGKPADAFVYFSKSY